MCLGAENASLLPNATLGVGRLLVLAACPGPEPSLGLHTTALHTSYTRCDLDLAPGTFGGYGAVYFTNA